MHFVVIAFLILLVTFLNTCSEVAGSQSFQWENNGGPSRVTAGTNASQVSDIAQGKVHARTFFSNPGPSGKELAMKYCRTCHRYPEPSLLDKHTWTTRVLPNMGWRLGIRENGVDPYADMIPQEEKILRQLNVYPDTPLITRENWDRIVSFYNREAPDQPLPQQSSAIVAGRLPLFKARLLKLGDKALPQTTLVKFDPATSQWYIGDAQNVLFILNRKLELTDSWVVESAPSDIDFPDKQPPRLLTMGIFAPSDQKRGRLASLDTSSVLAASGVFIESLPRPVQFSTADLNLDGKEDILICGFGNHTGKLSWFDGGNPAEEHVLTTLPGARRAAIHDFNHDGRPDIMVLMAQAYEQVIIFYNEGGGRFRQRSVLDFPPVYGVNYFELADFNKDGFQDILLANGDNWDLSPVKKNYHGVRIYLNDGNDNFREKWFYPIYGISKAIARDFDNDGDLDIAAISFYSDLDKPEEGFIYLSNQGKYTFSAFSSPEAAYGKWLTMDAGDADGDGDIDIVLGSYFQSVGQLSTLINKGILTFPQILVYTNETK